MTRRERTGITIKLTENDYRGKENDHERFGEAWRVKRHGRKHRRGD